MSERGVFLSPETLEQTDVRLVDVRDEWEYEGIGHLPGAVSVPFDTFRSADGDEGMLPGKDAWAATLSAAGIEQTDRICAYDDTHGVFAARFLVTAELYGHDPTKLHLLDGDYSAWQQRVERTAVEPTPTEYRPSEPESSPLIGFETVLAAVEENTAPFGSTAEPVIVDTREAQEYEESHLPGAVQLDWLELVDTDGTRGLKPTETCRSILQDRGITPDRPVILYCNTARRISHTYLALRALGYEAVAFYEGSLTEWETRGGPTVEA